MLNKFFLRPLEITIGGQPYRFCSVTDFEFALQGRTTVPVNKILELRNYSREKLKSEAYAISDIEKKLMEILSNSIDSPNTLQRAMKDVDHQIFSQDHNWRQIFNSLQYGCVEIDALLRVALYKYTQYLHTRLEIIKMRYAQVCSEAEY